MPSAKGRIKSALRADFRKLAKIFVGPWLRPLRNYFAAPVATATGGVIARLEEQQRVIQEQVERALAVMAQYKQDHDKSSQETDRLLLAMLKSTPLGTDTDCDEVPRFAPLPAIAWGSDRVLARHPLVPFMLVDPADRIVGPRVALGNYEPGVYRALRQLVKPGMTVVEAGSHQGFHTLTMAYLACPGGHVLALEPHPSSFAVLFQNLAAHGMTGMVTALPCAAYHENTRLQFRLDNNPCQSSLLPLNPQASTIEVQAVRIGDVLKARGLRPDFVHLDVEGAEPSALQGMEEFLVDNPGIKVLFEFYPRLIAAGGRMTPAGFLEWLGALGFRFWEVGGSGLLSDTEPSRMLALPANAWGDFVAARRLE
jgi:FkbM family methyltransferase